VSFFGISASDHYESANASPLCGKHMITRAGRIMGCFILMCCFLALFLFAVNSLLPLPLFRSICPWNPALWSHLPRFELAALQISAIEFLSFDSLRQGNKSTQTPRRHRAAAGSAFACGRKLA
jgi:hypothetical protein